MKRYKFKVKPKDKDGALDFPMDMLRYDRCYPVTTKDANNIDYCCSLGSMIAFQSEAYLEESKPYKGTIELQSNDRQPSSKAWESHDWLVISVESFKQ